MEITLTKGQKRNTLTCKRADGSVTKADLGPDFPFHDLAHFVVEKKFKLHRGFFGNIKSGMTIDELSDKETIKKLGAESWLSEIMTRNLQGLGSGAATNDQYIDLVKWELEDSTVIKLPEMTGKDVDQMVSDFNKLCKKWEDVTENGELKLIF